MCIGIDQSRQENTMPTLPEHHRYCCRTNASRLSGQIPVESTIGRETLDPAFRAHVQPGVYILGVRDERRPALRLESRAPVDRGRPAANGRIETVAGHLNGPVEHLLDWACGPLDP